MATRKVSRPRGYRSPFADSPFLKDFGKPVTPGSILGAWQPNFTSAEERRLQSRIRNAENRIIRAGGNLPDPNDKPWWMDVLDFIQRPQRAITGAIAEATDRDSSGFLDVLGAAWRGLSGQEQRDFDEVLNNLGWVESDQDTGRWWEIWKPEKGRLDLHDILSFTGDVMFDPLTYLTLGASTATKGAKTAAQARRAADQLIGVRAPFTQKEITLLTKNAPGIRKLFTQPAQKVTTRQARDLVKAFNDIGLKGKQRLQVAEQLLGRNIDSFKDLNFDEYQFLNESLDQFFKRLSTPSADAAKVFDEIIQASTQPGRSLADEFVKSIDNVFVPTQRSRNVLSQLVSNSRVGQALSETVGRALGGARYVPRQILERTPGLQQAIDRIYDIDIETRGLQQQAIDRIAKFFTDLKMTKEEREAVPYFLEDRFPKGFDVAKFRNNEKVQKAVQYAKEQFQRIANEEGIPLQRVIENYVPHIYRGFDKIDLTELPPKAQEAILNAVNSRFSKERKWFDTIAEFDEWRKKNPRRAAALDIERDIARILAEREFASIRAVQNRKMVDELMQMGFATTKKPKAGSKLVAEVEIAGLGRDGKPGKIYTHPEIARHLKQIHNIFTQDKTKRQIIEFINKVQNLWKQYVTAAVPAHYFRNFIGNVFNSRLAGVRLASYKRSLQILLKENPTDKEAKLIDEAIRRGVIHQGFFGADVSETLDQAMGLALRDEGLYKKLPNTLRRRVGEPMENWTRFAHFIDIYDKTKSFDEAAKSVKKYLFNYHELSPTDRTIRAFVPFYTWMRNNIPLQLINAVKQPRYLANFERLREDTTEGQLLPEWMEANFIGIGGDRYFNPYLPVQDLNELFIDPARMAASSTTPLLRTPFELVTNRNIFLDNAPIQRFEDGSVDWEGLFRYLKGQTGVIGKAIDTVNAARTGDNFLNELLGIFVGEPRTFGPEEQEKERMRRLYEYDRMLQERIRRLKSEGIEVPRAR